MTLSRSLFHGLHHEHAVRIGDTLHEDLVWHYSHPLRESVPITGMLCFYDERVDLYVDGEPA